MECRRSEHEIPNRMSKYVHVNKKLYCYFDYTSSISDQDFSMCMENITLKYKKYHEKSPCTKNTHGSGALMGVAESGLRSREFGIYLVSVPLHHEYRQSRGIGGTDNLL